MGRLSTTECTYLPTSIRKNNSIALNRNLKKPEIVSDSDFLAASQAQKHRFQRYFTLFSTEISVEIKQK